MYDSCVNIENDFKIYANSNNNNNKNKNSMIDTNTMLTTTTNKYNQITKLNNFYSVLKLVKKISKNI